MNQPQVVAAALASALAAASSSVLQHRSARHGSGRGASGLRLVVRLLASPLWLGGLLAAAAGLALHALALAGGRLTVVQPLLVSGVLFALPVSAVLEHRRPSRVEWAWALAVVAGLAGFLATARPSEGRLSVDADTLLAMTLVAGGVMLVSVVLVQEGLLGRHAAPLLAGAAGIGYGVTAALLKQTQYLVHHQGTAALGDWPLYALVVVGGLAIWMTQLAYQQGPLASSMPALTIGDPLASVVIGATAFHEHLAHTPGALAGEIVSFVVMAVAATQLARRQAHE